MASEIGVRFEDASFLQARSLHCSSAFRLAQDFDPSRSLWLLEPDVRKNLMLEGLEACKHAQQDFKASFLPSAVLTASPAIRCEDGVLWHPQQLDQWEWIVFQPSGREVAVELRGHWAKRDRVMIGFVQQEAVAEARSSKHPTDVGYFISLGSGSVMGPDGTNYSLGDTVEYVWLKQLLPKELQHCPTEWDCCLIDCEPQASELTQLSYRRSGLQYCLKLTPGFKLHLWVRLKPCSAPRSWTKLCVIQWRGGPSLPQGNWCPAIVFLPRNSMGLPQCAVTPHPGKGGGKGFGRHRNKTRQPTIEDRFLHSPGLELLSTTCDTFCHEPSYNSTGGRIAWPPATCGQVELCKRWLTCAREQALVLARLHRARGGLIPHGLWTHS